MDTGLPPDSERLLSRFAAGEREKCLAFLRKQYSLTGEDCEDIFQEAFMTLYGNVRSGRLKALTSSLSTYFLGICRLKAHEHIRRRGKGVPVPDGLSQSVMDGDVQDGRIEGLLAMDGDDEAARQERYRLVREIVRDLPHPCNELLWGFYRDNLSLKALAEIFGYSSENSVKVTKHRCMEKFRARYSRLVRSLF